MRLRREFCTKELAQEFMSEMISLAEVNADPVGIAFWIQGEYQVEVEFYDITNEEESEEDGGLACAESDGEGADEPGDDAGSEGDGSGGDDAVQFGSDPIGR